MELLIEARTERLAQFDELVSAGKRAYSPPQLQLYGSVKMLTASGRSGLQEGDSPGNPGQCSGTPSRRPCAGASDRRLKENLARIGTHPLGIGLYLFDFREQYKARMGRARQFGVMADEVEQVLPEAVVRHADGYKMVDYQMLGIERPAH